MPKTMPYRVGSAWQASRTYWVAQPATGAIRPGDVGQLDAQMQWVPDRDVKAVDLGLDVRSTVLAKLTDSLWFTTTTVERYTAGGAEAQGDVAGVPAGASGRLRLTSRRAAGAALSFEEAERTGLIAYKAIGERLLKLATEDPPRWHPGQFLVSDVWNAVSPHRWVVLTRNRREADFEVTADAAGAGHAGVSHQRLVSGQSGVFETRGERHALEFKCWHAQRPYYKVGKTQIVRPDGARYKVDTSWAVSQEVLGAADPTQVFGEYTLGMFEADQAEVAREEWSRAWALGVTGARAVGGVLGRKDRHAMDKDERAPL
jgi:hypothetical protein